MKIFNVCGNNGPVKNQFVIHDDYGNKIFQSYNAVIAKIDARGNTILDNKYWDYSRTTGKYRNIFLRETKAETEKKIKAGTYTLADLN